MNTILIMGGSNFISKSLAKYLIRNGYCVDILTRGQRIIDYEGFNEHIICDRKLKEEMQNVLSKKKHDFIFDISAYTKEDVEILLTSIDKTNLKKYIFCSSGAVYKPNTDFLSEQSQTGENYNWGMYGLNKKDAEDFIIESGIPYIIFRPTYIYGQGNNLYREAYFFDRIAEKKAIPMPFGNNIKTQFIHIDDLVKVFESAMNNKNASKIYNVTNPEVISWKYFISTCGDIAGKEPIIKEIPVSTIKLEPRSYFPFRDVTYLLDTTKLEDDGFYFPNISLKEGLEKTYKWYLNTECDINDIRMMNSISELLEKL